MKSVRYAVLISVFLLSFNAYSQNRLSIKGLGLPLPGESGTSLLYILGGEMQIKPQWAGEILVFGLNEDSFDDEINFTGVDAALLYYFTDKVDKSNFYARSFIHYFKFKGDYLIYDYWNGFLSASHTSNVKNYGVGLGIGRKQKIAGRLFLDINMGGYVALSNKKFTSYNYESATDNTPIVDFEETNKLIIFPAPRLSLSFLILKGQRNVN